MIAAVLTIELPGPLWMWAMFLALWMLSAAVNLAMDAYLAWLRHRLEQKSGESG